MFWLVAKAEELFWLVAKAMMCFFWCFVRRNADLLTLETLKRLLDLRLSKDCSGLSGAGLG
jgi:hypothetical protein